MQVDSRSRFLSTPVLVATIVIVAVAASAGIFVLRMHADGCQRTVLFLSDMETAVVRLSAVEWQAVAQRRADEEVAERAAAQRAVLARDIRALGQLRVSAGEMNHLRALTGSYTSAISREFALLSEGRLAQASAVDQTVVDPAFAKLAAYLEGLKRVHALSAQQSSEDANAATGILTLAAAVLVVGLIRRRDSVAASAAAAKAARDSAERAQRRFQSLVQNASDLIVVVDDAGIITYASSSSSRVLGRVPPEVEKRRLIDLVHRLDASRLSRALSGPAGPRPVVVEARMRHADGTWRFTESTVVHPVDDSHISGTVVTIHDATGRQKARDALSDSEERYRRLVEAAPDAIIVESRGRIVFANSAAAWALGGHSQEEIVGRPILDFVPPEHREAVAEQMALLKRGSSARTEETQYMRLDGSSIDVELAAIPTTFQNRAATQVIFRDITERKQIEQLKSDFVAMVSHELRSPLSVIVGNSWVIERFLDPDVAPPQVLKAARRIRERGNLMSELVESLLDLSQIQAGTFMLRLEDEDLGALVNGVGEMMPIALGNELAVEVAPDLPPVRCDARRISTAVTNLVANAVKFSPDGGKVNVRASVIDGRARISVSDEGIGISAEDVEHIFQRFTQADLSAARSFEGVGLGLYLVNCITRMHEGNIEAESSVGAGSTFTIDIPVAGPSAATK